MWVNPLPIAFPVATHADADALSSPRPTSTTPSFCSLPTDRFLLRARRAGELLCAPSDKAAGGRAATRISGAAASGYWVACRDPEAVLGGVSRAAEASALRVGCSPRSMMTFSALVSAARPNVS